MISDGALHTFICDIMVMPEYQNKGIASIILNQLVKEYLEADLKRVWLFAAPDKAGFYEKYGFSVRPDETPGIQLERFG